MANAPKLKYMDAKAAAELDEKLMSNRVGFQLGQLMELAGLSVAHAAHKLLEEQSLQKAGRVLLICGPGNNGGDGLVAARHLQQLRHDPVVWYPKPKQGIYEGLVKQLAFLDIPVIQSSAPDAVCLQDYDLIVDAIFGFSFTGSVRAPFDRIIEALSETKVPVVSVDAPSSWDIETGRPASGTGSRFTPDALISLSAPKPCAKDYQGRHFLGGRFLDRTTQEVYNLPAYPGTDQIVDLSKL